MQKKGASTLIVTVLLVLISITAVSIIAMWVMPLIQQKLSMAELSKVKIIIENEGTFFIEDSSGGINPTDKLPLAYVKITRQQDDSTGDLVGIKFIFKKGSDFYMYRTNKLPITLESKTYVFQLDSMGKPDTVEIAPVFKVGNREVTLDSTSIQSVPYVEAFRANKNDVEACSIFISSSLIPSDLPSYPKSVLCRA